MKKYLMINLECIGLQIIFAIVSIVLQNDVISPKLTSFFTAWLFLWAVHSTFWQLGNKERKSIAIINNNLGLDDTPIKQNRLKGIFVAAPFFVFNVLFLVFTCLINNDIVVTIQSLLQLPFAGFLPLVGDELGISYFKPRFIVCLVMYIPCITAYFSGSFNFSLTEKYLPKLIYKSKEEKK